MMRPRLRKAFDLSPEATRVRAQERLTRAEQQRADGERARADYKALNEHQDANMERLRALRLAKEAAELAAASALSDERGADEHLAAKGATRGRAAPAKKAPSKSEVSMKKKRATIPAASAASKSR